MTRARLRLVMAGFTYKAGWKIGLDFVHEAAVLYVRVRVPNAYPKNQWDRWFIATRMQGFLAPARLTVRGLRRWVRLMVADIERHETAEWLKHNGIRYLKPHPGSRT